MAILNSTDGGSREIIANVISAELDRQAHEGASRIDVPRLAEVIEEAIEPAQAPSDAPPAEGKRPEDLNSTNDD